MGKIYSDQMASSQSVVTGSYVAMTGSPYNPLASGRLRKLKLLAGGDAVTSLIDGVVYVRVRSSSFGGVDAFVAIAGQNIRTAPAWPIPVGECVLDLPVKDGTKMIIEIYQDTGATPVTPRFVLIGVFEAEGE